MQVTYIDHMGDDLTVVNAARVSMDKESEWNYDKAVGEYIKEADAKLIYYLAKHKHWTPFSHPQLTFRIKAPIFVARQLFKHKVGMTENEISRRYVDSEPEFYVPGVWRKRAENVKQGSSDDGVVTIIHYHLMHPTSINTAYSDFISHAEDLYSAMIKGGVAPEQARMVLPQSMFTEWYWTGSLAAYARICKLRLDPHAQKETQMVAEMIAKECEQLFPVSWKALMEN